MKKNTFLIILLVAVLAIAAIFAGRAVFSKNNNPPVDNNTDITQSNDKNEKTFTLYFASSDGMYLIPEERKLASSEADLPEAIVSALIEGPETPELYPVLNKETEVAGITVNNKIANVEFGDNFISLNTGGSTKEFLAIYSIVDSLTALDGIDSVTFSYGGNPVYEFGSYYFDEPCINRMSVND